jgi:phenylacetate-CoA ligase
VDHTGGTTGRFTLIYENRNTIINLYALNEARLRRWYGVTYEQKWAMFGGQKVVPLASKSPPFWVQNIGLNQLYFSVFHVTKDSAKYYVEALNRFSPTHLIVYPSILAVLSEQILEQGLTPPEIKVIFCNSEKVIDSHRKLMQEAFKCPVVDTYGMAELTSAGSECGAGIMHEWPEVGFLEVFNRVENEFVKKNEILGEFVMTGLLNDDMPLIRYRNGDLGTLPEAEYKCACGRMLPKFGLIQGRANDLIRTSDGRKLYILDSLFNGLPIIEAQVVQETLTKININLVAEKSFMVARDSQIIVNRLRQYLGDVQVSIVQVEKIARDGNGKFHPFVSLLS